MASSPKPFVDYTTRLRELSSLSDPSRLLAHAYVRYLGDMSGGQFIQRRIAKAYNLDLDKGDGIRFYNFNKLGGTECANTGDLKKIKEWYRDGMNAGIGEDVALKGRMILLQVFFLRFAEIMVRQRPYWKRPTRPSSSTRVSLNY